MPFKRKYSLIHGLKEKKNFDFYLKVLRKMSNEQKKSFQKETITWTAILASIDRPCLSQNKLKNSFLFFEIFPQL